jgi:hypothetical protein
MMKIDKCEGDVCLTGGEVSEASAIIQVVVRQISVLQPINSTVYCLRVGETRSLNASKNSSRKRISEKTLIKRDFWTFDISSILIPDLK